MVTRSWILALAGLACAAASARSAEPRQAALAEKAFFRRDLYISTANMPLVEVRDRLPNRDAWARFTEREGRDLVAAGDLQAFIDPRSGTATNILGAFPMIPGSGVGNTLTLAALEDRLGRRLAGVDAAAVGEAVRRFVEKHRELLGIELAQLGDPRATEVTPDLWQVSFPQVHAGVPVRHGRLAASISHGNLVTIGTETWGNVEAADVVPRLASQDALEAGFLYAEGRRGGDRVLEGPALELIPLAPELGPRSGGAPAPMGAGYTHALAWTFVFERPPDSARWEVVLDARSGEVLSFQDVNDYAERQIKGGTYPLTSTEVCPDADRCGTMRSNPMPFADTGFAAPNDFANSAGMYDYTSGTATTTLSGRFVRIQDACGALSARSSSGTINLGGATGQHDCEPASGGGAGNTAAARTSFYELNKVAELARGWLPGNPWLNAPLTANVNGDETCNAFWNGSTVTLHRAGDGCRNMGEIASVLDHEWAHGLDDNDANGTRGASREGLADIAALYRLETSCVSYGFRQSPDQGCGATADGTGVNANEAQVGASYCATDCSGARDADFARHTPAVAATALGFVCRQCDPGPGACGRQRHCSAAPVRQAAWDLAARDLTAAPFNLDSRTAFIVANKLFYTGSGNIGDWHACTCPSAGSAGASNGCGAGNGFIQWLTADDDNGFLLDGTPHLTAIRAAHNRHGIGCPIPGGGNSGCAGGPSAAPALTATPRDGRVALSWSAVPGATRYWVFRTEGHAACDLGKVRIAEVTGRSFTDRSGAPGGVSRGPGVANDRPYYYQVMAAGPSSACFGRASNCAQATPGPPGFALSCPSTASVVQGGSVAVSCRVFSSRGFDRAVTLSCLDLPPGIACRYEPNPVTPPADGVVSSTLTLTASSRVPLGSHVITVHGLAGSRSQSVLFLSVRPNDEALHDPGREVSADGPRQAR